MNIYSGSREGRGLAAALTNPTCISLRKGTIKQSYSVNIFGHEFPDAESAYFALVKQCRTEGQEEPSDLLMVQVIAAKFRQHPKLLTAVRDLGGIPFLETCEHFTFAKTERFQKWEGKGRESRFIRNLIAGYESVILPPA